MVSSRKNTVGSLKFKGIEGLYHHFKVSMAFMVGPVVLSMGLSACGKFSADPKLGSVTPSAASNPAQAEAENKKKLAEAEAKKAETARLAQQAADAAKGAPGAGGGSAPPSVVDLFADTPAGSMPALPNAASKPARPEAASKPGTGAQTVKIVPGAAPAASASAADDADPTATEESARLAEAARRAAGPAAVPAAAPDADAPTPGVDMSSIKEVEATLIKMSNLRSVNLILGELNKFGIAPGRKMIKEVIQMKSEKKDVPAEMTSKIAEMMTSFGLPAEAPIAALLERVDSWPASLVLTLAAATLPKEWGGTTDGNGVETDTEETIARDKQVVAKVIQDLNTSNKETVAAARKLRAGARTVRKMVDAEALIEPLLSELSTIVGKEVTAAQFKDLIETAKFKILSDRNAQVILAPRGSTNHDGMEVDDRSGNPARAMNP